MLQGVCIEYNGEAKCDCPAPYAGPQCRDASEVADFMLNEINNNLASAGASGSNNDENDVLEEPLFGFTGRRQLWNIVGHSPECASGPSAPGIANFDLH